ncbi:MAG: phosphoribosylformylglycinamidine cyclo-ligase [Deltaproteobacteria bacterium]|nr:phosphoribosylformylglycinamidine cyclo-ligase [Deltaproteobacteria bacterium]
MTEKSISYADAGVNIDAGEEAVEHITAAAKRTHIPGVVSGVGGFGGLFALKEAMGTLEDPVLVSGTDGVGTKLLVAIEANMHSTIGQDLVAMCVNDILTSGARPLFFLDYFATGRLDPKCMVTVVEGIAKACEKSGCALIGGETAELPGMYAKHHYDLAGFAVGAVERKKIVDGKSVGVGDTIIGLASSGVHSNGYSLARKILFEKMGKKLDDVLFDKTTVAAALLVPTRLYVRSILDLLPAVDVKAMAHITGGGLPLNLTRSFPANTAALVDERRWPEPAIFDVLRMGGPVTTDEMRRTFNCGIGFAVVVGQHDEARALESLRKSGEQAFVIGSVVDGAGEVRYA